ETRGAVVREVEAGSSAEKAGIRAGDVVVALNGRPLRNSSDLRNAVGLVRPGETVELTLLRDGRKLTVRAQVGKAAAVSARSAGIRQLQGAVFRDAPALEGVLVAEVESGSPAWRHGLREGDV